MLYLLAIIFPPLAVLLSGKPIEAMLNVVLTLFGWLPGVAHAAMVVSSHQADQRSSRQVREMRQQGEAMIQATIEQGKLIARDGAVVCMFCGTSNNPRRQSCSRCYEDIPRS